MLLNLDKITARFTWRPKYVFTLNCSMKYFVTCQQCKGKPLLPFGGKAQRVYIVDSYIVVNKNKNLIVTFHRNNGYTEAPPWYIYVLCPSYYLFYIYILKYFHVTVFCSVVWCVIFPAFRAFSSIVRQMAGYNSQRRGTARTSQIFLLFCTFRSLYSVSCLFVRVYSTVATGCQLNCS
jgi:hypothetical protein